MTMRKLGIAEPAPSPVRSVERAVDVASVASPALSLQHRLEADFGGEIAVDDRYPAIVRLCIPLVAAGILWTGIVKLLWWL